MPYQKTKDGSLVNEVTLGDGYPLSNDLQPLKIGGCLLYTSDAADE